MNKNQNKFGFNPLSITFLLNVLKRRVIVILLVVIAVTSSVYLIKKDTKPVYSLEIMYNTSWDNSIELFTSFSYVPLLFEKEVSSDVKAFKKRYAILNVKNNSLSNNSIALFTITFHNPDSLNQLVNDFTEIINNTVFVQDIRMREINLVNQELDSLEKYNMIDLNKISIQSPESFMSITKALITLENKKKQLEEIPIYRIPFTNQMYLTFSEKKVDFKNLLASVAFATFISLLFFFAYIGGEKRS